MIRSCGLKRKSISFGRTNTNHFTEGGYARGEVYHI
jgi:hypothetical protein